MFGVGTSERSRRTGTARPEGWRRGTLSLTSRSLRCWRTCRVRRTGLTTAPRGRNYTSKPPVLVSRDRF